MDYIWRDNNDAMINRDTVSDAKLHKRLVEYIRYLGVPVHNVDYGWGDNDTMIPSGTVTDAKLHKRHDILSLHFERSLFACGY